MGSAGEHPYNIINLGLNIHQICCVTSTGRGRGQPGTLLDWLELILRESIESTRRAGFPARRDRKLLSFFLTTHNRLAMVVV